MKRRGRERERKMKTRRKRDRETENKPTRQDIFSLDTVASFRKSSPESFHMKL